MLDAACPEARTLLRQHRASLDHVVGELLEKETLDAAVFEILVQEGVQSRVPLPAELWSTKFQSSEHA
jgi:ATP-dependent Zn protease